MKGFRLASLIVMSFIPNVPGLAPVPDVGICFSSPAVCSSKGLLHSRPSGNTCIGRSSLSVAPLSSRSRSSRFLISASAVGSSSDVGLEDVKKKRRSIPFTLRRARPHELDLLAILSTEAFTPKGAWFDVVQRIKFLLVRWDLQAQFHQRFYSVRIRPDPVDHLTWLLTRLFALGVRLHGFYVIQR